MIVTHAMSYDILVISAILYPLGVIIDFWEKNYILQPSMANMN
jgi:hypothetical protein